MRRDEAALGFGTLRRGSNGFGEACKNMELKVPLSLGFHRDYHRVNDG